MSRQLQTHKGILIIDIQGWKLLQRNLNKQISAGANVLTWLAATKKSQKFLGCCHFSTCCILGALQWDNMLMGTFRSSRCDIYNRLVNACVVKTCYWIVMPMYYLKKYHFFGFSSFLIVLFICMRRGWSFSPANRTTGVEHTYRTLTAIPFKLEVDNSLKLFAIAGI